MFAFTATHCTHTLHSSCSTLCIFKTPPTPAFHSPSQLLQHQATTLVADTLTTWSPTPRPAYVRWIVWFIIGTTIYLFYGLHHSQGETPIPPAGGSSGNGYQRHESGMEPFPNVEPQAVSHADVELLSMSGDHQAHKRHNLSHKKHASAADTLSLLEQDALRSHEVQGMSASTSTGALSSGRL